MGNKTSIEWTNRTWSPTTGCTKVSAGCRNCYAERQSLRFKGTPAYPVGFDPYPRPDRLAEPLAWTKPGRCFVCHMSDLFHVDIPFEFIAAVWAIMAAADTHTFQVLTKRPQRAAQFFDWLDNSRTSRSALLFKHAAAYLLEADSAESNPAKRRLTPEVHDALYYRCLLRRPPRALPNVWLGVSVEDSRVLHRVDQLRELPAAVRFLSVEPLIGPLGGYADFSGMDWVIIGGESGPGSRPLEVGWARQAMSAAESAGAAVFFKQMGTAWAKEHDPNGHPKGGDPATWPEEFRVRDYPKSIAEVAR